MAEYKTLRELVLSYSDTDWFKGHKANIMFELNHCELHHIDSYYLNLYNAGVRNIEENEANSSIAYLLGIVATPPTGKVHTVGGGFPDIDSDVEKDRRPEVFEMLKEKYGEGFAHLGTFTYTGGKKAFKDSARIHGMGFDKANKISSMMPEIGCPPLDVLLEENDEIKALYNSDPEVKEVWDDAINLSDCVSQLGVHACGVALSDRPLWEDVPLWDSKGAPVIQWEGNKIEDTSNVVKLDVLGLKTLTVLNFARDLIKKRHGIDIDWYNLPMDNEAAYKVLWNERNYGIFQFEEAGMSGFVNACKPKTIHDIAVIVSTYRPGPLNIPGLVQRIIGKISGELPPTKFRFPKYDHIFSNAHNELIFQEGFLRLSKEMCGFSDIKADVLRKAVGKKDAAKLASLREDFINGAVANGEDKQEVAQFWEELLEFARYAFNASHAYSYGHLTYYTAWLKANYPEEFYCSIITCETDPPMKKTYMEDAVSKGINILPPDLNESVGTFGLNRNNDIIYGLSGIRGIGDGAVSKLIELRPYSSFGDFLLRTYLLTTNINKKVCDSLILSGAVDSFGYKRSVLIRSYSKFILDFDPKGALKKECRAAKALTPEAEERIKEFCKIEHTYFVDPLFKEFTLLEILEAEKDLIGVYISGNPMDVITKDIRDPHHDSAFIENEVAKNGIYNGATVCQVSKVRVITTKTGKLMAFIEAKDISGRDYALTAFSNVYEPNKDLFAAGKYLQCFISAKPSYRGTGIDCVINSVLDLTVDTSNSNEEAASTFDEITINMTGIPSPIRFRTILNKIRDNKSEDDNNTKVFITMANFEPEVSPGVKINKTTIRFGPFYIKTADIDVVRDFNGLRDVTISTR